MLAGCSSSTLLSPRHRLRSEEAAQFQACHFQLPSMNTQRLDLPCTSFSRKETSRSQPIRPVGLSVEKTIDSKPSSCSLKQNIRLPPLAATSVQTPFSEVRREVGGGEYWRKGKNLKRFAEEEEEEEDVCVNRAKRKKRGSCRNGDDEDDLSFAPFGGANFWLHPGFSHPQNVCFAPSEVISSPWVESGVNKITTEFGEKEGGEASHGPAKDVSDSSNSSGNQSLVLRVNEEPGEEEVGKRSRGNPYSLLQGSRLEAEEFRENQGEEEEGFELVSMLAACVEAIRSKNIALINHQMDRLGDLASPQEGSSIRRLVSYYTEALALRVSRLWPHIFHIATPRDFERVDDDPGAALRLLNQVSPILKFIHFTSNEVILRAFEGKDRVHIIDFEIKQGLQWPSLFQSLASRPNPPSHVRITGVGESKQELNETGERLSGFAEELNLPFEFHPVVDRLEDVRLWMLHVKEDECVAVNCVLQLHKMGYDGNGGRAIRDFLGLIRSANPSTVLIAEQEAYHNDPRLEIRVANSLKYYSAIFDSLDSILPPNSPVRMKIEEMFGAEIRNVIGCEGWQRVERHEKFEKWKRTMEENGFKCSGISEREVIQAKILLKMYSSCEGYSVGRPVEGEEVGVGALTLKWEDQPLYTVSSWTPLQVSGSSSFSHT